MYLLGLKGLKKGDFLLVLPVKKEKNPAPQAPAGGREGMGEGKGGKGAGEEGLDDL